MAGKHKDVQYVELLCSKMLDSNAAKAPPSPVELPVPAARKGLHCAYDKQTERGDVL